MLSSQLLRSTVRHLEKAVALERRLLQRSTARLERDLESVTLSVRSKEEELRFWERRLLQLHEGNRKFLAAWHQHSLSPARPYRFGSSLAQIAESDEDEGSDWSGSGARLFPESPGGHGDGPLWGESPRQAPIRRTRSANELGALVTQEAAALTSRWRHLVGSPAQIGYGEAQAAGSECAATTRVSGALAAPDVVPWPSAGSCSGPEGDATPVMAFTELSPIARREAEPELGAVRTADGALELRGGECAPLVLDPGAWRGEPGWGGWHTDLLADTLAQPGGDLSNGRVRAVVAEMERRRVSGAQGDAKLARGISSPRGALELASGTPAEPLGALAAAAAPGPRTGPGGDQAGERAASPSTARARTSSSPRQSLCTIPEEEPACLGTPCGQGTIELAPAPGPPRPLLESPSLGPRAPSEDSPAVVVGGDLAAGPSAPTVSIPAPPPAQLGAGRAPGRQPQAVPAAEDAQASQDPRSGTQCVQVTWPQMRVTPRLAGDLATSEAFPDRSRLSFRSRAGSSKVTVARGGRAGSADPASAGRTGEELPEREALEAQTPAALGDSLKTPGQASASGSFPAEPRSAPPGARWSPPRRSPSPAFPVQARGSPRRPGRPNSPRQPEFFRPCRSPQPQPPPSAASAVSLGAPLAGSASTAGSSRSGAAGLRGSR